MTVSTDPHNDPVSAMQQLKDMTDTLLSDTESILGEMVWKVESASHAVTAVDGHETRKTGLLNMTEESYAVTKYVATALLVCDFDT